jgi:hypothetical protein
MLAGYPRTRTENHDERAGRIARRHNRRRIENDHSQSNVDQRRVESQSFVSGPAPVGVRTRSPTAHLCRRFPSRGTRQALKPGPECHWGLVRGRSGRSSRSCRGAGRRGQGSGSRSSVCRWARFGAGRIRSSRMSAFRRLRSARERVVEVVAAYVARSQDRILFLSVATGYGHLQA